MVNCRSCGRIITSGTIRCTNCGSPFHLSCSHRYQISPNGVFNVCCGMRSISNDAFQRNTFQMRNKRNKRKQPTIIDNFIRKTNNTNTRNNTNNRSSTITSAGVEDNSIRNAKIQKTVENMVICEKPIIIEKKINEIIEEDINENENETEDFIDLEDSNSVEILDDCPNNDICNDIQIQIKPEREIHTKNVNVNNDINNKITLDTVWQGISSLQSSISNISNCLDTVSMQLNTFDPRINDLESNLNSIKMKTSNFESMQTDVSGLRTELERMTNELEEIKTNQSEKINVAEILMEVRDRDIKSRNIIIYNVPEDNLRISQDYSTLEDINKFNDLVAARDTSRAREILSDIPNIDLEEFNTRRLGRMNPNVCRPLRVTLQSRENVITVMKNRRLVNKQYTVKTDLTKCQQRKIKELKEELDTINTNQQNPTMTIRFISGEPHIVPIQRNYMKNE